MTGSTYVPLITLLSIYVPLLTHNIAVVHGKLISWELTWWEVDLLGVDLVGVDFMRVDLVGLTQFVVDLPRFVMASVNMHP